MTRRQQHNTHHVLHVVLHRVVSISWAVVVILLIICAAIGASEIIDAVRQMVTLENTSSGDEGHHFH